MKRSYLLGLKEEGYSPEELLEGKYRPVFASRTRDYLQQKKRFEKMKYSDRWGLVPATKKNIIKMARFNIRYGDEPYQEAGKKMLLRFGGHL